MSPEDLARLERAEAHIAALHQRLSLLEQRPTAPPVGAEPLPADLGRDPDASLTMPGGMTDDPAL